MTVPGIPRASAVTYKFILVKLAFVAPKNADTNRIMAVESVIYCYNLFSSFKPNANSK